MKGLTNFCAIIRSGEPWQRGIMVVSIPAMGSRAHPEPERFALLCGF
jgi:hypothetical protein